MHIQKILNVKIFKCKLKAKRMRNFLIVSLPMASHSQLAWPKCAFLSFIAVLSAVEVRMLKLQAIMLCFFLLTE